MKEYEFTLYFTLPNTNTNPESYLDKLYEAGCNDAIVGIGTKGSISFDFIREAPSAMDAIASAKRDVTIAIPQAIFTSYSINTK